MVGGLAASIIVFAVGAVLDFANSGNQYEHGFNITTIGVILMAVGAAGAFLSVIALVLTSFRRRRTVVDDGRGHVSRRDETYI